MPHLIVLQEMAASIIIHFNELDPTEVVSRIEGMFGSRIHQTWSFPPDEQLLRISAYDDFDSEYEAAERDEVCSKLGGIPTASFDFEIRRAISDDACDMLERFVRVSLDGLNFVVDDMWCLISCHELQGVSDFLDCYRYKKLAEQDAAEQPATRAEFKPEANQKLQPKSEGCSRQSAARPDHSCQIWRLVP